MTEVADEEIEETGVEENEQGLGACSTSYQCSQCNCVTSCTQRCCNGAFDTTCGSAGPIGSRCTGDTTCSKTNCARAVVTSAAMYDIREGDGGFGNNGPYGFAFFGTQNGSPKYGRFPRAIGGIAFATNVYASNLQGPLLVDSGSYYKQWEWTANGTRQISTRSYPLEFAKECAATPGGLTLRSSQVWEDDDGPANSDDYLGVISVNNYVCNTDVFSRGLTAGWSNTYASPGSQYIDYLTYRIWCYRCTPGSGDCKNQVWY